MEDISPFKFIFESDPKGIKIGESINPRMIERVYIKDSLFSFYPYMELYIKDDISLISDNFFFVEGLKFHVELGSDENLNASDDQNKGGYIKHNYVWSEDSITNCAMINHLNGTNALLLISEHYIKDRPSTQAFNKPLSDIAEEIGTSILDISKTDKAKSKYFIGTTKNSAADIWYQAGRNCSRFLKDLAAESYSSLKSQTQTPYETFINCDGDFYFMSYAEMYEQSSVAKFKMKFKNNSSLSFDVIQGIEVMHGGLPVNKKTYTQEKFYLPQTGEVVTKPEEIQLKDKYIKINGTKDKFLVLESNNQVNSLVDFGLYEEDVDVETFKAKENNLYLNSATAYRIVITVLFNPKCVSGKTVDIEIEQGSNPDQLSSEYSGKWLIIQSEHLMNNEGFVCSKLTLAKPSISIDKNWPYKADLI